MFVAAVPPPDVLESLEEFLEPRREYADFRWSSPEQLHVTLAFLASVPDRCLDELVDGLTQAASRRTPVALAVAGGGAFPHVVGAKVIWAGLRLDEAATAELDALSAGCRRAASRAGVVVDGSRFRPHLTLARTAHPVQASNWVRLLDAYTGPPWRLDEISLVESHLGEGPRRRPRYEVVETFALGPVGRP